MDYEGFFSSIFGKDKTRLRELGAETTRIGDSIAESVSEQMAQAASEGTEKLFSEGLITDPKNAYAFASGSVVSGVLRGITRYMAKDFTGDRKDEAVRKVEIILTRAAIEARTAIFGMEVAGGEADDHDH